MPRATPDGMLNPQQYTIGNTDNGRVLAWFRSILGLRNNSNNDACAA